ncbi:MAG TPA: biotin/lipoyl-containing protein [Kofleriaceae bacterium]|nr:biotin/lipoyl-containing protein [Kofleriaceae bacterium]
MRRAGRLHAPEIDVLVAPPHGERATIELRAPRPGSFVPWIAAGELVAPGTAIGELVVLGRAAALVVPRSAGEATGIALQLPAATHPVGYGDLLVALDPSLQRAPGASAPGAAAAGAASSVDGLVFCAPTSGRFYGRPGPDKPAFVAEGTVLTAGTTVCLLEVMKTFHRVTYGGPGLPDSARVRRVLVADGADVNAGEPLLALE